MHDLIYAIAFIAMVAAPAMVAAVGGRKEYTPGPDVRHPRSVRDKNVQPAAPPVRSGHRVASEAPPILSSDALTLPMHNARGMANR
jgi:hypothetical protein